MTATIETGQSVAQSTPHGHDNVIETHGLTKRFGGVIALERLDLAVPPAAIGLLGPNGAGKTTLLRILLGLSPPSEGSASVLGFDVTRQGIEVRERVGYMPEGDCLPSNATAADFVGHMGEMSGLPAKEARQRAADVLYQVGLDEERYRLIKGFSTGMKQRVKLAQAIVHDPGLVFLDEPTAGMDPPGRDSMLELINRVHRLLGMTVVLSSHILEDIERVCDYVVIINGGRLIMAQPIGRRSEGPGQILIRIEGEAEPFIQRLNALGVHDVRLDNHFSSSGFAELVIDSESDAAFDAVRDVAADLGVGLRSVRSRTRSLEELYLQAVGAGRMNDTSLEGGADERR
jgi:ABC-2 type transport system ATP-binding protein